MAKCPLCTARKGKRECPARGDWICARCCAENRLVTIHCPKTCPHLTSEHYQLGRRRQKALSSGRELVDTLARLFRYEDSREFAFLLLADAYWWMEQKGAMSSAELQKSFEDLESLYSPVRLAGVDTHGLGLFLHDLIERGPRHQRLTRKFARERQLEVVRSLGQHFHSEAKAGREAREVITAYFGELDFEADLDYSPKEELGLEDPPAAGFQESKSGLILPD